MPRLMPSVAGAALIAFAALQVSAAAPQVSAKLIDSARVYEKNGVAHLDWRTHWELNWPTVAGAVGYDIEFFTSEGVSARRTALSAPPLRLEVAKGDHAQQRGRFNRELQLATIRGLLSVRVVARLSGQRHTALTPWIAVGSLHP